MRSATWRSNPTDVRTGERARSRASGFTLVEVLVALVIVALALGAALRAAGALAVGQERLTQQVYANWSADNRLVEIRLARTFVQPGVRENPCPQGSLALVCVDDVRLTPNPSIRRVDVLVYLGADRSTPLVRRSGFVANLQTLPEGGS